MTAVDAQAFAVAVLGTLSIFVLGYGLLRLALWLQARFEIDP